MKTAIVYASVHHGNTKKLLDEISKQCEVDLIDATIQHTFRLHDKVLRELSEFYKVESSVRNLEMPENLIYNVK